MSRPEDKPPHHRCPDGPVCVHSCPGACRRPPEQRRTCPDGGACHHGCDDPPGSRCWRRDHCGPLSGVFPGDRWPDKPLTLHAVMTAYPWRSLVVGDRQVRGPPGQVGYCPVYLSREQAEQDHPGATLLSFEVPADKAGAYLTSQGEPEK